MKKLLLPICPGTDDCPDGALDLFIRLARRFKREGGGWVVLAGTTWKKVRRHLDEAGIPTLFQENVVPSPYLPTGAAELAACLIAEGRLSMSEAFCVADYRNINLKPADLFAALSLAESSGSCVLSTREPVDHPIQLQTFGRMLAADLMALLDSESDSPIKPAGSRAATRPFFLDWSAIGVPLQKLYRRFVLTGDQATCLVSDDPHIDHFLQVDRLSARRLISPDRLACHAGEVAGVSAVLSLEEAPGLILRGPDGVSLDLYLRANLLGSDTLLTLTPWGGTTSGAQVARARELKIPDPEDGYMRSAFFHGATYLGPVAQIVENEPDWDGFVIAVRHMASTGPYDLNAPLFRSNQFWDTGPDGTPVIRNTGRTFSGRHDAPPLVELDKALFAGTAADLTGLESSLAMKRARIFHLDKLSSLKIENAFDLLRNEVRLQAFAGNVQEVTI